MLDHEALAAAVQHDLLAVLDPPAAGEPAACPPSAATKLSLIGGASQKESVAPPAFTKRNKAVMPPKLIEPALRGPVFLAVIISMPATLSEIDRSRLWKSSSPACTSLDTGWSGGRKNGSARLPAAHRGHQRLDVVGAIDEGARGSEHGGVAALGQRRQPRLEIGHQRMAGPGQGYRIDRIARALLRAAVGQPGGERVADNHRISPSPAAKRSRSSAFGLDPGQRIRKGRRRITSPPLAKRSSGSEPLRRR